MYLFLAVLSFHCCLGAFSSCCEQGLLFIVSSSLSYKGDVICISEIIDISPRNLDSSLCFLQSSISHAAQGTLKSLLQHHSLKASVLLHSAFFIVQLTHPFMDTGKTIALTRWTFVSKVMSLLFNMLSRLVIVFLPRCKSLSTMYKIDN